MSTSAAWRSPAVRDQAKGQRVAGDPILKLEARHGTDSSQTPRWREMDSNHRFRDPEWRFHFGEWGLANTTRGLCPSFDSMVACNAST